MPHPDLSDKLGLLIDDIPEMRTAVRVQLRDIGLEKCETARNIKEAIDRISAGRFDLIVCDYNLGQGADGQQLLELVRRRNILPLTTAFLMITGETGYEQVSTAADYSPDDYLLKPFTAETLGLRVARVFEKKAALRPIYQHMGEKGDPAKAINACNALLAEKSRYTLDVVRMKGELLLDTKRHEEALALFQKVLDQRATPWAQVGKARALSALGNDEEAKTQLEHAVQAYPNYVAAYDMLAKVLEKTDKAAAQKVVEKALEVAPSTQRQRRLGGLAMDNKDFGLAEKSFRRAVDKDRTGFFKSHDDYAGLAKSCVEQGKTQEAMAAVKDMGQHFAKSPGLVARQAAVESLVHSKTGNKEAAKAALKKAIAVRSEAALDPSVALEIAGACFASGDEEQAKAIIQSVAEDHHENDEVLAQAQAVFQAAGRADEGSEFLESTRMRMIALNNEAVAMARGGDLDKAIEMLQEAADRLVNNAQVSINAALALLMRIQRQGATEAAIEQAHRYITQAQRANPSHPRLGEIAGFYRKVAPSAPPLEGI